MASQFTLTPAQYQKLLQTERQLHDLLPECDAAENCGIEVQNYRDVIANMLARISNIKATYAPKINK